MIDGEPKPLKPETQQFLAKYPASLEFQRYKGNLSLDPKFDDTYTDYGRQQAVWSRAFVERLFSISTVQQANDLLEPWERWRKTHIEIWAEYDSFRGENQREHQVKYDEVSDKFSAAEIPPEIRQYQGGITDKGLRSVAHWEIFRLTGEVRGAIDLFEDSTKPASLDTVFRVQRIMERPFYPVGGLDPWVVKKPDISRDEDKFATEEEWKRWEAIQAGQRVRYLQEDENTELTTLESGVVQGFDMNACDGIIGEPSVLHIGAVTIDDRNGFFNVAEVSNIRLPNEPVRVIGMGEDGKGGVSIYVDNPNQRSKVVDMTTWHPKTGTVTRNKHSSMSAAANAMKRILQEFLP